MFRVAKAEAMAPVSFRIVLCEAGQSPYSGGKSFRKHAI